MKETASSQLVMKLLKYIEKEKKKSPKQPGERDMAHSETKNKDQDRFPIRSTASEKTVEQHLQRTDGVKSRWTSMPPRTPTPKKSLSKMKVNDNIYRGTGKDFITCGPHPTRNGRVLQ